GNKGDAYTFIAPDQDRYASEVVKALKLSGLTPPEDVQALADAFMEKVRQGKERHGGKSGFGGKGLEKLDKERSMVKKIQKITYGAATGETLEDDDDDEEDDGRQADSDGGDATPTTARRSRFKDKDSSAAPEGETVLGTYGCELDINDYPQKARWRATNHEALSQIIEQTGAAITTRGIYVPPGKPVPDGERKLYLSIESDSERSAEQAKSEIKRLLTEATILLMEQDARGTTGRYSVV
ncbi:pre-mRNA processing RNA-helicase, partial [Coemansia sp. RSA 25]